MQSGADRDKIKEIESQIDDLGGVAFQQLLAKTKGPEYNLSEKGDELEELAKRFERKRPEPGSDTIDVASTGVAAPAAIVDPAATTTASVTAQLVTERKAANAAPSRGVSDRPSTMRREGRSHSLQGQSQPKKEEGQGLLSKLFSSLAVTSSSHNTQPPPPSTSKTRSTSSSQ